jgi:hypothetical protein
MSDCSATFQCSAYQPEFPMMPFLAGDLTAAVRLLLSHCLELLKRKFLQPLMPITGL